MERENSDTDSRQGIQVTEDVRSYIESRKCNFRVCTSCGGAILLPVTVKPPKPTDLQVKVGEYTVYVSRYQARGIRSIHRGMIPRFFTYY